MSHQAAAMHESILPRRRIFTTAYDEDEEDYDVFYFYPSQNRVCSRLRLSSEVDEDETFMGSFSDPCNSIESLPALEHLRKLPPSPPHVQAPQLAYPEHFDDRGIQRHGYSRIFRTGLWAQSRISRRLDAFIAKAIAKLRSLKRCLARRAS